MLARGRSPLALPALLLAAAATSCIFASCIFAPQPLVGLSAGESCGADIDCANGLVCACGTCESADEGQSPPSCEVMPDDRCPAVASPCFAACGDEAVVGLAQCFDGRETCEPSGGVLRDDCDPDTCWGPAGPGEICIDGDWECEFPNPATGLCETFNCPSDPGPALCVASCADDDPTVQICLADEWQCEVGFPQAQCGGCVGSAPPCFDTCADLNVVATAACVSNEWSCSFVQGTVIESVCCADDVVIESDEIFASFQDLTCATGQMRLRYLTLPELSFPALRRSEDLVFWENQASRIALPSLERVDGSFSIWMNPELLEIDLGSLEEVTTSFEIAFNESLPQCLVDPIVAGLVTAPTNVAIENNDDDGVCADAGVPDAGPGDGGVLDGGIDAGQDDAGVADAGPSDAGPGDAGVADAGPSDAGPSDAGPSDAGAGDGEGADGGAMAGDAGPDGGT